MMTVCGAIRVKKSARTIATTNRGRRKKKKRKIKTIHNDTDDRFLFHT